MRGHIRKRGKASWQVIVSMGLDAATGKYRQQSATVKGTKKDAERTLSEMLHQIDTGSFVKPARSTLGEYLRQWLRDYAASNVRARTLEGYRGVVERHLIPNLGGIALTDLRPQHLQAYYTNRLSHGRLDGRGEALSPRSVLHHHRILFEALGHAVRWGLVGRNVAQAIDPPRPRNKEMMPLDGPGLSMVLEAARSTPYQSLFVLAAHTGMRRSELLGLRWKDVDLEMATVSVTQVMHRLKGGTVVYDAPKTAKSRRLIALTPTAVLTLRAHREKREADCALLGVLLAGDSLVFCHVNGSPLAPDHITRAFSYMVRRLGLSVRLHDLRHTHATLMLKQGVHPKVVSERLGHSTIAITLDVYSHVTPGLQEAAARGFEENLPSPAEQAPVAGGQGLLSIYCQKPSRWHQKALK